MSCYKSKIGLTLFIVSLFAFLIVLNTGCNADFYDEEINEKEFNLEATVQLPKSATEQHLEYAHCMLEGYNTGYIGYSDPDNVHIWLVGRCRHMEPPPLEISTPAEFRECRAEYANWVISKYGVHKKLHGWEGARAVSFIERVCAPSLKTS